MFKKSFSLLAAVALCAAAVADVPHYTVVILHPEGASGSTGLGIAVGQQVGASPFDAIAHAVLWSGTAASMVDLDPGVGFSSAATATDGEFQGGYLLVKDDDVARFRAALWHGTAASYVSLHPNGASDSGVSDMEGGIQVGNVSYPRGSFGGYWTGTADSFTPLLPAGFQASQVGGMHGHIVVGDAESDFQHAYAWDLDANTAVDFSPAGYINSTLSDTDGIQHVGLAGNLDGNGGFTYHAGVWDAATHAFTDLHPSGWQNSYGFGVSHGIQVGDVEGPSTLHAAAWNGTAASFVDLQTYLPPEALFSQAIRIDDHGNIIGSMGTLQGIRAVMWVPDQAPVDTYDFHGFFAPLTEGMSFKAGRTLPVKFSLTDTNGAPVTNVHPAITLEKVGGGTIDVSVFGKGSNDGANFRLDPETGQFMFNLSTKDLQPGQYTLTVTVPENGQTHSLTFTIEAAKGGKGK